MAEILRRCPTNEAALIPVLHLARREFGWLSEEVLEYVAGLLQMPKARVYAVATFYSMFRRRPTGKHLVQVCRSLSCSLLGVEAIIEHLKNRLAVALDETTADGLLTVCTVECLGACEGAPAMLIDEKLYDHLTTERVDQILDELRASSRLEG